MRKEKMVGNGFTGKLNRRTDQVTGMGPTKIRKVCDEKLSYVCQMGVIRKLRYFK